MKKNNTLSKYTERLYVYFKLRRKVFALFFFTMVLIGQFSFARLLFQPNYEGVEETSQSTDLYWRLSEIYNGVKNVDSWVKSNILSELIKKESYVEVTNNQVEYDCFQNFEGDPKVGVGFSNGNKVANDILLNPYSGFSIEEMVFAYTSGGGEPNEFEVEIYETTEDGNIGESLGIIRNFDESNLTFEDTGEVLIDPIFEVTLNLSNNPILLSNESGDLLHYWIVITSSLSTTDDFTFWVSYRLEEDVTNETFPTMQYKQAEEEWIVYTDNFGKEMEGVMKVGGTCSMEDCDGQPDAGEIEEGSELYVCANEPFILNAVNYTNDVFLTFSWEQSVDNGATWSEIEGANTPTFLMMDGISESTEFRFIATCESSGINDITEPISVLLNEPGECYCIPNITSVEPITHVIFENIDNITSSDSNEPYEDFTDLDPALVKKGNTYEIKLEGNTKGNYTNSFTVFIDWNQNGILSDDDEIFEIGTIQGSTGTDGQQLIGTINIPMDASTGHTRMRVLKTYGSTPATSPCDSFTYGQIEDYTISIEEAEECTGTPDSGTITVSPDQGEPGTSYNVSSSGYTSANGISYQWQSNTNNEGWIDEGAVSDIYSDFSATAPIESGTIVNWRLQVNCDNSGESSYSNEGIFTVLEPTCGQETNTPNGGFENAHGNLGEIEIANDFTVNAGQQMTINEVSLNILILEGATIDDADINFYNDSENGPGELIESIISIAPSNVENIGEQSGFDWIRITFNLENIIFTGDQDTKTTYWVGIRIHTESENSYWEITTSLNTDNQEYMFIPEDGEWQSSSDLFGYEADGVMSIVGDCEYLGLDLLNGLEFTYYPNPVNQILNIVSNNSIESITVYNLMGQQVMNLKSSKIENGQIDVRNLSSGVYLFRVLLKNGQVETFKILKR